MRAATSGLVEATVTALGCSRATSAAKDGPLRYASWLCCCSGSTRCRIWCVVSRLSFRMPFVHDTMICGIA